MQPLTLMSHPMAKMRAAHGDPMAIAVSGAIATGRASPERRLAERARARVGASRHMETLRKHASRAMQDGRCPRCPRTTARAMRTGSRRAIATRRKFLLVRFARADTLAPAAARLRAPGRTRAPRRNEGAR
jgi:hypothetical protein